MKKVLSVFAFCAISAMAAELTGHHHGHQVLHETRRWSTTPHARPAASRAAIRRFW